MAAELHPRSGKLIGLSNSNRTARRNQPVQEFNHGLVLSKEPLRDRDVFTVRIDKKVNNNRPRRRRRRAGVRAAGVREQPAGRAAGPRPSAGRGGGGLLLPGPAHAATTAVAVLRGRGRVIIITQAVSGSPGPKDVSATLLCADVFNGRRARPANGLLAAAGGELPGREAAGRDPRRSSTQPVTGRRSPSDSLG